MDSNRRTRLKARKGLIVTPRPIQTRAPPIGQHPGVIKSELWMCVRAEFSPETNARLSALVFRRLRFQTNERCGAVRLPANSGQRHGAHGCGSAVSVARALRGGKRPRP